MTIKINYMRVVTMNAIVGLKSLILFLHSSFSVEFFSTL